jgi:hypothetical protein
VSLEGFHPATDIADAMRVVEHVLRERDEISIQRGDGFWRVCLDLQRLVICDDPFLPRALTLAAVRGGPRKGDAVVTVNEA